MPETQFIWKFSDGISDWLRKGHEQMAVLKAIDGTSPYTLIQSKFIEESNRRGNTIPSNTISIRKIIKGYEKVGLINIEPKLKLTELGNEFVNAALEDTRRVILRKTS